MADISKQERIKEITNELEEGIKGLFESEKYKTYLNTLAKFHNYSFRNCVLIARQKPNATRVAGFTTWRDKFKRFVKKGEKGIAILAPMPYKMTVETNKLDGAGNAVLKDDGSNEKETREISALAGYKTTYVFDVSQTDGKPLPSLGVDELRADVEDYKKLFTAFDKASPVPIRYESTSSGAKGYYNQKDKHIAIKEGMSELQNIKTLIHETAHARLHDIDKVASADSVRPDMPVREVEAESVAYTVCKHYGLDTSDYSFAYIASWSGDKQLEVLKESLEVIRNASNAIIEDVDKQLNEAQRDEKSVAVEPTLPPKEALGKKETAPKKNDKASIIERINQDKARPCAVHKKSPTQTQKKGIEL